MTAAELLVHLRDASVVLELTPEGRLRYEAHGLDLTDVELALLRVHRDDVIALLRVEAADHERDAAVTTVPRWRFGKRESEALVARGWTMPGPLGWCVACNGGTVWADSVGRARHPWCAARSRRSA